MRVLNLVTTAENTFFRHQVESLERMGVTETTVSIPGSRPGWSDIGGDGRTPLHYLRAYPTVLRRSFGPYDLLHANFGLTAPLALAQPRLPVVLTLWGSDLFGRYGVASRWCARRCDAVIVMSEEMAAALDVPCHVIPHGVDLERFAPRPQSEALPDVGWRHDARHVLFPYPPSRGVKNYPRARRVVEAARERVDDPVELHAVSGVPHRRIPDYMNAADVLLLASDREGSPNVVKEAMACNLPVVSTDVGDVRGRLAGTSPSAVGETEDELVDALVDVLDAGERSDGRAAVADVGLERTARRIYEVYESVAGDRREAATTGVDDAATGDAPETARTDELEA